MCFIAINIAILLYRGAIRVCNESTHHPTAILYLYVHVLKEKLPQLKSKDTDTYDEDESASSNTWSDSETSPQHIPNSDASVICRNKTKQDFPTEDSLEEALVSGTDAYDSIDVERDFDEEGDQAHADNCNDSNLQLNGDTKVEVVNVYRRNPCDSQNATNNQEYKTEREDCTERVTNCDRRNVLLENSATYEQKTTYEPNDSGFLTAMFAQRSDDIMPCSSIYTG